MKLINKTKWCSKDLKRLCQAVIKNTGSHKDHTISIITTKKRFKNYHGLASIGGSWIDMFVPLTKERKTIFSIDGGKTATFKDNDFDVESFAQILEHEIGHNLGQRHDVMSKCNDLDVGYVKGLIVKPQEEKVKPKADIKEVRHQKAVLKVKELQSKLKRTETLLKKWQGKVRRYEKINGGEVR